MADLTLEVRLICFLTLLKVQTQGIVGNSFWASSLFTLYRSLSGFSS